MNNGMSSYSKRLAYRRSCDPSNSQSEKEKKLPMPRPFHLDYFTSRGTGNYQHSGDFTPMPHENLGMVSRFKNKETKYPLPRFKKKDTYVKFDHFAMNYTGWNR